MQPLFSGGERRREAGGKPDPDQEKDRHQYCPGQKVSPESCRHTLNMKHNQAQ